MGPLLVSLSQDVLVSSLQQGNAVVTLQQISYVDPPTDCPNLQGQCSITIKCRCGLFDGVGVH